MSSLRARVTILHHDPVTGAFLIKVDAPVEFKKTQASFYKNLDTLAKKSNSMSAIYRTLVQMHRNWGRVIKKSAALSPSDRVTTTVRHAQTQKEQIKQNMLEVREVQRKTQKMIEGLERASK